MSTALPSIYTLSLHDALPIFWAYDWDWDRAEREFRRAIELNERLTAAYPWHALHLGCHGRFDEAIATRSEEHTSELQSLRHLVCRLLLEKKKKKKNQNKTTKQ